MHDSSRTTAVGVFTDRSQAEQAIDELYRAGFTHEQVGFVVRDGDEHHTHVTETAGGPSKGEGAVGGMLAGAGVGAMIAAAGSLLIPGVGPILAGGILAASLGGAALGAAAGGVLGGLIAAGVPEVEARHYESEFNAGRMIVTVRAPGRIVEAESIMSRHGASDYNKRAAA